MAVPAMQYQFINWKDGMKITQKHLTAQDQALRDIVRDTSAMFINGHNYGLLPAPDGLSAGLQVTVIGDTVRLLNCRAITPGGLRVEWDCGDDQDAVSLSLLDYKGRLGSAGIFYVVLRISLSNVVETGEFDMEETPLRKPYTALKPMLELLSAHERISDANSMPIFRVRFEGQLFSPDYDYIPPTTNLFGENLLWYYETCGKQIGSIHQTAIQISRKINGMREQSAVARDVNQIVQRLIDTGHEILDHFRLVTREQPPVYFVLDLVKYARSMRIAVDSLSEHSAGRLFQYLRNNVGGSTKFNVRVPEVTKSLLDSMVDSVLAANYNHDDCNPLLDNLKNYLDFLEFLMQSLLALPYVEAAARWDIA